MKILYTATMLSHICQFHQPYMKLLQEKGHEVHVASYNNLDEKNGLKLKYCDKFIPIPFKRWPWDLQNIKAYKALKKLLNEEHYDVILCNTPVGGMLTRLAAKKARREGTRVLYMVHGFHFYKGAPLPNWLLFYPMEKWMAHLCDGILTINEEDYALAKRKFKNVMVEHIHGVGVQAERFHPAAAEDCVEMRKTEGLSESDFVILCTGELNKNKDQKTLVQAGAKLKNEIPGLKILLAGNGPLEDELRQQIKTLDLEDRVKLLGYRTNLEKVAPAVDLIVSCSHREGLGLNIIEAMLCQKPVVAAHNRGHDELITDGVTGYLFDRGDADMLADRILAVYRNREMAEEMGKAGYRKAQPYTLDAVKNDLMRVLNV